MGLLIKISLMFICLWTQASEPAFWEKNSRLLHRIQHLGRVVVEVNDAPFDGKPGLQFQGIGVVSVPLDFTATQMSAFEKLPEISSHFHKVVHRPDQRELFLHMKAFGYQARLLMSYQWISLPEGERKLRWQVTQGHLKGMHGHYRLRPLGQRTEVQLHAKMGDLGLPLPAFVRNFTLEVIGEKVALKMRTYIENQFSQQKAQDHGKK